jgi:hypothetical protein
MDAQADFLSITVTEFQKLKELADKALAQTTTRRSSTRPTRSPTAWPSS